MTKLSHLSLLAVALLALAACQGPVANPSPATNSPTPAPSSVVATMPPPGSPSQPSLLPYVPPTDGKAPVLINDDGSGLVLIGMSVAQFYQQASAAGWSPNPANGPGDDGFVHVGKTTFIFGEKGLFRVDVADDSFRTEKGLIVGDTVETMTQLYGAGYDMTNASDKNTYTYTLPSGLLFYVVADEGTDVISGWGMA